MLSMAGVDHERFGVAERELFTFTPSAMEQAYASIAGLGVREAVLLCTCHRTELYVEDDMSALEILDRIRKGKVSPADRRDMDAVVHLHRLAAGLCSRIIGDEQIITQIAAGISDSPLAGPVLRQLFGSAVSAGKRARSEAGAVRLHRGVAFSAVEALERELGLRGRRVLVIGSGAMACLCAKELMKRGSTVLMTLRQGRKSPKELPEGVTSVEFDARYEYFGSVDAAIGATASPHYVITPERLRGTKLGAPLMFIDLAMPRDIDPACADIEGVTLLNVDELRDLALPTDALSTMERVAREGASRFSDWLAAREILPDVAAIKRYASGRMARLDGDSEQRDAAAREAEAMLERLLFGVKVNRGVELFSEVCSALAEAARNDMGENV